MPPSAIQPYLSLERMYRKKAHIAFLNGSSRPFDVLFFSSEGVYYLNLCDMVSADLNLTPKHPKKKKKTLMNTPFSDLLHFSYTKTSHDDTQTDTHVHK